MLDRKNKIARAMKLGDKRDVSQQIITQIKELLASNLEISLDRERPWASITFTGTRHQIIVRPIDKRNAVWINALAQLPEHEFTLPGCFVADLTVEMKEKGQHALIEVLTIIDPVKPQ